MAKEYLNFSINDNAFLLNACDVSEIIEMKSVAKLPACPNYLIGIINLRGSIVPIIDLAKLLNIPKENNLKKVLIILQCEQSKTRKHIGICVDKVFDVYELDISMEVNQSIDIEKNIFSGVAQIKNELISIIDSQFFINIDIPININMQ